VAAGVTQPGGAGTTIYIYDDASSASGTGYTWAEIASAFGADFIDNGTNLPSYRSAVSIQVGDTGTGTATTSLIDATDSTVIFDDNKTLTYRSTQTSSWFTTLGTKVGTGDVATGNAGGCLVMGTTATIRGTFKFYGCKIVQTKGAISFVPYADEVGELVNCLIQHRATGTAPIVLGSASIKIDNLYNVDISSDSNNYVATIINARSVRRVTMGGPSVAYGLSTALASVENKDCNIFGSPATSDYRWSAAGALSWGFVRPGWSGNAAKFSSYATSIPPLDGSQTREFWIYNVKVVDSSGVGISGIPVKLTDTTGAIPVNTTTDSTGQITFLPVELDSGGGLAYQSDIFTNAVPTMDHYVDVGGTGLYTQRHRSPFLAEINMSYQTGYNSNYESRRYYFNWPGYPSITTTSGTFEDIQDIISLGPSTPPAAILTNDLPLSAPAEIRFEVPVPATT